MPQKSARRVRARFIHRPSTRWSVRGFRINDPARTVTCPREAQLAASDCSLKLVGEPVKHQETFSVRLSKADLEELGLIGYIEIAGPTYRAEIVN